MDESIRKASVADPTGIRIAPRCPRSITPSLEWELSMLSSHGTHTLTQHCKWANAVIACISIVLRSSSGRSNIPTHSFNQYSDKCDLTHNSNCVLSRVPSIWIYSPGVSTTCHRRYLWSMCPTNSAFVVNAYGWTSTSARVTLFINEDFPTFG
jgi:hypothetical protein